MAVRQLLAFTALLTASFLVAAAPQQNQLKERVFHGSLQLESDEQTRQLTMVLDRSRSEYAPADGQADLVIQFAPLQDEQLPEAIWGQPRSFDRVTIERDRDSNAGLTLVLPNSDRYRMVVPADVETLSGQREQSRAPVIFGYALSWNDVQARGLRNDTAMAEFKENSLLNCSREKAGSEEADMQSSLDCTNGGPGTSACSVSCPMGFQCSIECLTPLGYYACCSCYTGCTCKSNNNDISPY